MLLVQNVPDDKLAERAMVQNAMAEFLQSGGKIQRIGVIESEPGPAPFNGERYRKDTGAEAHAALRQKMQRNLPQIIKKHRAGVKISAIAKHYKTSTPTIKQHLLNAGEDPHANIRTPAVSFEQILSVREMVEGGSAISDIAKWTGLTQDKVIWTMKEFQFKRK